MKVWLAALLGGVACTTPPSAAVDESPPADATVWHTRQPLSGNQVWQLGWSRGQLRHVRGPSMPLLPRFASPEAAALALVREQQPLLRVPAAALRPERSRVDALGMHHVRLQQHERGVPVLGGQLTVHFSPDGALRSLDTHLVPDLHALELTPRIDAERAVERAREEARARYGEVAVAAVASQPSLAIHARRGEPVLAWVLELAFVDERPVRLHTRIDARDGSVIECWDEIHGVTGSGRGVFGNRRQLQVSKEGARYTLHDTTRGGGIFTHTANDAMELPGELITSTSPTLWDEETPNGAGSAVDAHFHAGVVYDFFFDRFGRRSIDGEGGPIVSTVHYGYRYDNAFWDGKQMAYGDGDRHGPFAAALDVVAHELTHGVTKFESGLDYVFQSGALNEAISDIFGALVEHSLAPDTPGNWTIGEDIGPGGMPVRNMIDTSWAEIVQPSHMDGYLDLTENEDRGGVHFNSGIINHAAYLMTMGGTHELSMVRVGEGIGWERAEQLWYRINTEYLQRQSEFDDCVQASLDAAEDLEFTADEIGAVRCAWDAVGLMPGACSSNASLIGSSGGSNNGSGSAADVDFDNTAGACAVHAPGSSPSSVLAVGGMLAFGLWRRARRCRTNPMRLRGAPR